MHHLESSDVIEGSKGRNANWGNWPSRVRGRAPAENGFGKIQLERHILIDKFGMF